MEQNESNEELEEQFNDGDSNSESQENSFLRESLPRDYLLEEINRLKPINEAKKLAELEKLKNENDLLEHSLVEKRKHDEDLTNEIEKLRISIGIKEEDIISCQKAGKSLSEKSKSSQSEVTVLQSKVKVSREKLEGLESRLSALENESNELSEVFPLNL